MMAASDVIESYVRDVARYLPRTKRNDVAFELRALLQEELAAKAAAHGRAPDREMVMELLSSFGRPAEAAARYHPRMPLIDPADNHNFLIWAVFGSLVISVVSPHNGSAYLQWIVVIPKKGRRDSTEEKRELDPRFKLAQRFRAGIEGSISFLKRILRLARCMNKGWRHYVATVGATVLAHNLLVLARC